MKRSNLPFLTLVAALLSGCADTQPRDPIGYSKTNATQQEFLQARYECVKDATFVHNHTGIISGNLYSEQETNCDMYRSCMEAKGFSQAQNGFQPTSSRTNCDPY